jgi:hypothetical protein
LPYIVFSPKAPQEVTTVKRSLGLIIRSTILLSGSSGWWQGAIWLRRQQRGVLEAVIEVIPGAEIDHPPSPRLGVERHSGQLGLTPAEVGIHVIAVDGQRHRRAAARRSSTREKDSGMTADAYTDLIHRVSSLTDAEFDDLVTQARGAPLTEVGVPRDNDIKSTIIRHLRGEQ